jgi:hypothetical protein
MKSRAAAALVLLLVSAANPAFAERIRVRVLDVAAGRVYFEPGADKGLRVGDPVNLGGKRYEVVAVSASFAAISSDDPGLTTDSAGFAEVDPARKEQSVEPIAKPRPLSAFRGQWNPAVVPALAQHPKSVPLGAPAEQSASSLRLWLAGFGAVPLRFAHSIFHSELGMQLHYEPLVRAPLAFDADLRALAYSASNLDQRPGADSRPTVLVRQLEGRYGDPASAFGAAGRLRYASSTLGMLDGVRVQSPSLSGLTLGAFGGYVPDALDGAPSERATRFGGELALQNAASETRFRAVAGGHASRFEGAIDERRVRALAEISPRFGHFAAYSEVSFYDPDNRWGAPATELSAASAEAEIRAGPLDLGLRGGLQRPERSRWLASLLPPEWLCVTTADPALGSPCVTNDATLFASADAGLNLGRTLVTLGGSGSRTEGTEAEQLAVFAHTRVADVLPRLHFSSGASATRGTILERASLLLSPALSLERAEVSLRYQPAITRYQADGATYVEHGTGVSFWVAATRNLEFSMDTDLVTGSDIDFLLAQAVVIWRSGI